MSLLGKINFRRILVVFLVQATLFLGLAFDSGNQSQAFAQILNRAATGNQTQDLYDQDQFEQAKERRREAQAQRSEQASEQSADENVREKLNLDEPIPESTKKFFKQIQGKEPIIDKTEPTNAQDYTTPKNE
jgi:hypothetical protein